MIDYTHRNCCTKVFRTYLLKRLYKQIEQLAEVNAILVPRIRRSVPGEFTFTYCQGIDRSINTLGEAHPIGGNNVHTAPRDDRISR